MSLDWQPLKINFKAHFITLATAPALCVLAVLVTAYIYGIERDRRDNIIDTQVITISSERSGQDNNESTLDAFLDEKQVARNETLNRYLDSLLVASAQKQFTLKTWLRTVKREMSAIQYRDFLIFAARKTTQNDQFILANELFAEIGRRYFDDDLTGFYRAYALDQVGNYRLAKRTYEWQLERHPNHQSSAINYGFLLLENNASLEAIQALKHAVSINSGQRKAKSLRFLARAYQNTGQHHAAIKTIERSILFAPDSSRAWSFLGTALGYLSTDNYTDGLDAHQKAIALLPKNHRPYLDLAHYQFSQLRFDEARENYAKANTLNRRNVNAQIMQALNLYFSSRPYSAEESLNQMQDLTQEQARLVEILQKTISNQAAEAKAVFLQKPFEFNPSFTRIAELLLIANSSDAKRLMADSSAGDWVFWPSHLSAINQLLEEAKVSESIELSSTMLNSLPNNPEVLLSHARSLVKADQVETAIPFLLQAHELQPNSRRIAMTSAKLLKDNENIAEALDIVEVLLKDQPRFTRGMLLKAELLLANDQFESAEKVLIELLERDDKNILAAYELALLQEKMQRSDKALVTIADLLSIESTHIPARLLKAEILANDDSGEALEELERVLKLEPNNSKANQFKERLLIEIKAEKTLEVTDKS